MSVAWKQAFGIGLLFASGCGAKPASVFVDLRTDMVGGVEFVVARSERFDVLPAATEDAPASDRRERQVAPDDDALRGLRIAEFRDVSRGEHVVRVRLLDAVAGLVVERNVIVNVRADTVVTVVLTRNCSGVECPGDGDPSAVACLGGRCVDPRCTPESPEACPAPLCTMVSACTTSVAPCAQSVCDNGVCLVERNDGLCGTGEYCHPLAGCTPLPGLDAGVDVGVDAGIDLGAGVDARIGADGGPDGSTDPRADAAAGLDAAMDARTGGDSGACTWGPWTNLSPILNVNSTVDDTDPKMSWDGLELYFDSDRGGGADIWVARRSAVDVDFDPAVRIDSVSSGSSDLDPSLASDGLTLYFGRNDGFLYRAIRVDGSSPFANVTTLPRYAGDTYWHFHAYESLDRLRFYFTWRNGGAGVNDQEIALSTRARIADPFAFSRSLTELNVAGITDDAPFEAADGLTLYFSSTRSGQDRIYVASRATVSDPWSMPRLVSEIDLGAAVGDPALSADGRTLLFTTSATAKGSVGARDLWWATRQCQ